MPVESTSRKSLKASVERWVKIFFMCLRTLLDVYKIATDLVDGQPRTGDPIKVEMKEKVKDERSDDGETKKE